MRSRDRAIEDVKPVGLAFCCILRVYGGGDEEGCGEK